MAVHFAAPRAELARGVEWRESGVLTQILVLTTRSLGALVVDPRMILVGMLGPLLMLLVFGQIFASVANTPNFPAEIEYIDFLVPAIMLNTVLQSVLHTSAGWPRKRRMESLPDSARCLSG